MYLFWLTLTKNKNNDFLALYVQSLLYKGPVNLDTAWNTKQKWTRTGSMGREENVLIYKLTSQSFTLMKETVKL